MTTFEQLEILSRREGIQTSATVTSPAAQLLINGDFETDVSGWAWWEGGTSWKSATLEQFTLGEFPSGQACMRVTFGSGSSKYVGAASQVSTSLTAGQTYIFSGWINIVNGYPNIYAGEMSSADDRRLLITTHNLWVPFVLTYIADGGYTNWGFKTATTTSQTGVGFYVDGIVFAQPAKIVVDGATVECLAYVLNGETYYYNQRVTCTLRNPYPPLIVGVEKS